MSGSGKTGTPVVVASTLPDPDTVGRIDASQSLVLEAKERFLQRRVGKDPGPPRKLPKLPTPVLPGTSHLVIGDSHSEPEVTNQRYDWLGRMIVDV